MKNYRGLLQIRARISSVLALAFVAGVAVYGGIVFGVGPVAGGCTNLLAMVGPVAGGCTNFLG